MNSELETPTIPQLVEDVRAGIMPRRRFIQILTTLGVSATGAGIIATVAASRAFSAKPVTHGSEEIAHNIQLHQQHLANQTQGNGGAVSNDYAEHAIVHDSLYTMPVVGHAAIMQRKGLTAIPDLQIRVTNRKAEGSQLLVEWEATGTHNTDLPGLPASGRAFTFQGVTVVIRHDGKIVHEAIYYDVEEVKRQLQ